MHNLLAKTAWSLYQAADDWVLEHTVYKTNRIMNITTNYWP